MVIPERKEEVIVEESNFLDDIKFRYIPYWPLFAILLALFFSLAYVYSKIRITPVYVITATLVVNDQQKGVEEGQSVRSLNAFATTKIVENEVQVLKSRTLVTNVVNNLHLYAPLFGRGPVKPVSAYTISPVIVEARNPEQLKAQGEIEITYDARGRSVKVGGKYYPLNQWLSFPFGTIRFLPNPNQKENKDYQLYFSLLSPRVVAEGLQSSLNVSAGSKLSTVINIAYTDPVPERGEDIVNELLTVYKQASQLYNTQLAATTLNFVENRLQDVERELDSIESRVQQFKSQQGVVDLSEQGRIYLQNVAENDRRTTELNMQLSVLDQVENYVRSGRRTGIVPTTLGIDDPVLADLLQRLNRLELDYANIRTTVPENNNIARSIENEIQKIRPNILNIVENQRARLTASRNNLNSASNRYSSQLRSIPQQERALLEISRQQAIKNDVYAFLLQRREEAALSNASTLSDSRIVDRAEASIAPVSSGKLISFAIAALAAILLGIVFVFIKEGVSNKVLFRSFVEKSVPFPVVGEIANRRYRKEALQPAADDKVLTKATNQLLASMGLFDSTISKKKFLVTSFMPKEGKTFLSNLFAIHLAATGKRVVLLDLNLHDQKASKLHKSADQKGFSDYIEGGANHAHVIVKTGFANLDFIPSGKKMHNPLELFLNERTAALFGWLESQYDFVVIDSPPLELVTDAFALAKYCDVTLFTVRHGLTPKDTLIKFDENAVQNSFSNVALIFNGVKARGFLSRYFGYGYGYGFEKIFRRKLYLKRAV